METNKNQEIEKTLGIVNQIQKAEMPDFFYTRLKARMENELVTNPKLNWVLKPSFAIPILTVVLMINVVTVSKLIQKNDSASNSQTVIESFQSDYNLNSNYGLEIY